MAGAPEIPLLDMADFATVSCLAHNAAGRVFEVRWQSRPAVVKFPANREELEIHTQMNETPGVLPLWACVRDANLGEGLLMPRAQRDLQGCLEQGVSVAPRELSPVARALFELHAQGWLHRDVHPGNLVFWQDAWHLIDFGLSRPHAGGFRCPHKSHAVIRFASLAQLENREEHPEDDWYSFGLTVLSALHGKLPWSGLGEPQVLLRKASDPYSPFGGCATREILPPLMHAEALGPESVLNILNDLDSSACSCPLG